MIDSIPSMAGSFGVTVCIAVVIHGVREDGSDTIA
jgi:hypothetical protein